MILKELSKLLSPSLHYLDLHLANNPDYLRIVLENCEPANLKKLLIRNLSKSNVDTTLEVIRDFIKGKKIEYLAYYIDTNTLKDEAHCKIS